MQTLFSKLKHPILANLAVNFNSEVEMYPRKLPDLYQGEPLMISYHSAAPIEHMQATGALHSQNWQQTLTLQNSGQQSGLDVLWARRKIAQLERDKYKGEKATDINQQILQLAMKHHLVSNMTSLIAIDVTPTAPTTSLDKQVKNHRPKGQTKSGVLPQTATPAVLQALIATLLLIIALCVRLVSK